MVVLAAFGVQGSPSAEALRWAHSCVVSVVLWPHLKQRVL